VFAIEELSRSLRTDERNDLAAVILAGVTSLSLVGDYTYLVDQRDLSEPKMWLSVPDAGSSVDLCGVHFARVVKLGTALPAPLRRFEQPTRSICSGLRQWPSPRSAAVGGTTYGTGYSEASCCCRMSLNRDRICVV